MEIFPFVFEAFPKKATPVLLNTYDFPIWEIMPPATLPLREIEHEYMLLGSLLMRRM